MKLLGPTTEVFISDHDGFENMNTWADGVAADAAPKGVADAAPNGVADAPNGDACAGCPPNMLDCPLAPNPPDVLPPNNVFDC